MKTIIGSFDRMEDAERAARALRDAGFLDSDINFVANDVRPEGGFVRTVEKGNLTSMATGAVAGGALGGAAGLAASLMGLAIPGIGPILAAGPIVATLVGAGAGAAAGGLIGGLTDLGVAPAHAEVYAESVRRGGTLVTVRTDETHSEEAASVLRNAGAIDIGRRADEWRASGWTGFDPEAAPYSFDEIERNRSRYMAPQMMAASSDSAWANLDEDFHRDYEKNFADAGAPFDEYAPAYRYGADVVQKGRYANKRWDDVEAELRSDWERDYPNLDWTKVRDAARYGFTRAR
jgi:hypothetical protein